MAAAFSAAGATVSPGTGTKVSGVGKIESGDHPDTETEGEREAPEIKQLRKPQEPSQKEWE